MWCRVIVHSCKVRVFKILDNIFRISLKHHWSSLVGVRVWGATNILLNIFKISPKNNWFYGYKLKGVDSVECNVQGRTLYMSFELLGVQHGVGMAYGPARDLAHRAALIGACHPNPAQARHAPPQPHCGLCTLMPTVPDRRNPPDEATSCILHQRRSLINSDLMCCTCWRDVYQPPCASLLICVLLACSLRLG